MGGGCELQLSLSRFTSITDHGKPPKRQNHLMIPHTVTPNETDLNHFSRPNNSLRSRWLGPSSQTMHDFVCSVGTVDDQRPASRDPLIVRSPQHSTAQHDTTAKSIAKPQIFSGYRLSTCQLHGMLCMKNYYSRARESGISFRSSAVTYERCRLQIWNKIEETVSYSSRTRKNSRALIGYFLNLMIPATSTRRATSQHLSQRCRLNDDFTG